MFPLFAREVAERKGETDGIYSFPVALPRTNLYDCSIQSLVSISGVVKPVFQVIKRDRGLLKTQVNSICQLLTVRSGLSTFITILPLVWMFSLWHRLNFYPLLGARVENTFCCFRIRWESVEVTCLCCCS